MLTPNQPGLSIDEQKENDVVSFGYNPKGSEEEFRGMLATLIKGSFIVAEDNPLNIVLVKDVIENKQHPFRNFGRPDIAIYPSKPIIMFRKWAHLHQHNLTVPFFIETKTYGETKEGVNQGNVYKYNESGNREKRRNQTDRKYGDFRVIVTDPEMFEFHKQEGSEIQARELEHHNLWKTGLGCLYRRHFLSNIFIATFNEQDRINFVPLKYIRDYPVIAWRIRELNSRIWNSRVYYGDANSTFYDIVNELEKVV